MPQFGIQNHPNSQPTASQTPYSFSNQPPIQPTQPIPLTQPVEPSSPTMPPKQKKPHAPLKKDQILLILCIALGALMLIFAVTTIIFATNGNDSSNSQPTQVVQTIQPSAENLGFYPDKIENPTTNTTYSYLVSQKNYAGNTVLDMYINQDNTSVDIYVNWEFVNEYYGLTTQRNDQEKFTITFTQPVAQIIIGRGTQLTSDEIALFLLADGTIEYMPIASSLEYRSLRSFGQLGSMTDIVKFYNAHTTYTASEENPDAVAYSETVLAQQASGTMYDLRNLLMAAVNKDIR